MSWWRLAFVELPAVLVDAWLWLYRGLLLLVSVACFVAVIVTLLRWAAGYPL